MLFRCIILIYDRADASLRSFMRLCRYGGVFIVLSLPGVGAQSRLDRFDIIGSAIALAGVAVISVCAAPEAVNRQKGTAVCAFGLTSR